jgi:hypothetical protein
MVPRLVFISTWGSAALAAPAAMEAIKVSVAITVLSMDLNSVIK